MRNDNNIRFIQQIIERELIPLIDSDYALLDVPDYDNIGDNLIWQGELDFLEKVPYQKKYECSYLFFEDKHVRDVNLLLFQGGGNFGDIYDAVQNFRLNLIRRYTNKKIIIFPQTIYYQDEKRISEDAKIINKHPDLTICVRDERSCELAKRNFLNAKIILLPDMAFCIDSIVFPLEKGKKKLLMYRKDGEKNDDIDTNLFQGFDILDWPTFNVPREKRNKKLQYLRRLNKIATLLQKIPILRAFVDARYGIKGTGQRKYYIEQGLELFKDYHEIHTTRLHGLILGILMGIEMKILDNNYGKLTGFYNKWLSEFDNVELVNQQ